MLKYKILLAPFPFGDLRSRKYRPVLCLTEPKGRHKEIVLAYITSNIEGNKLKSDLLVGKNSKGFKNTGLKVSSVIKLNKLLTLPKNMVEGQLGFLSRSDINKTKKRLRDLLEI